MIDSVFIPVVLSIATIIIFIAAVAFVYISDSLSSTMPFFSNTSPFLNSIKLFIVAMFFAIPSAGVILSLLVRSNPVFLVVAIPLLLTNVFLSVLMKDVMIALFSSIPGTSSLLSDAMVSNIIYYYPTAMLIFAVILIAAQFVF